MSKCVKVSMDDKISILDIDFNEFDNIFDAVGGFFTIVRTPALHKCIECSAVMLVDDDGYAKGLEPNFVGSCFYSPGVIVGDIILCREWCCELEGFDDPEQVVTVLKEMFSDLKEEDQE